MAKILVVDDQAVNRDLVVMLVGHRGHQALQASDGAEALEVVRRERPALVISDILMPTMDGFEFVRRLRADATMAATDVIFYTAHYHEREARNLAQACGVSRVLVKPCEPQDILQAIDDALAHAPVVAALPVADTDSFEREHLRLMTDKLSEKIADLQHTNRRLAALNELNLYLASERDPLVLLDKVCRGARDLLGAKYAVLAVRAKEGDGAHFFTSGIHAGLLDALESPRIDQGPLGRVLAQARPYRMTNPSGDATALGLPAGYPSVHAGLAVPLMSLVHTYGWLCLADKLGAQEFEAQDEQILSVLAAQVGRIYENGSLYREVRRHAEQLQVEVAERKRALEELQASEAGLHRAQLVTRLAHAIAGPDGVFESWAETLPPMVGLDASNMAGSTREWLQRVHPEDQALFRDKVVEATSKGQRVDFTYRLRHASGAWLHLRQVTEPLQGQLEPGGRARWFHTIQDISEQKRAEEELRESDRRFSDMLDNMEMVSLMVDRDARITYCNNYLLRLTGWKREEVIGQDWFAMFVPPGASAVRQTFDDLLANQTSAWHHENEIMTRTGARRLIRWNNTVLRAASGDVIGTASVGEDITDSKEAERKIRRLNRVYAVLSGINTLIVRVHNRDDLFRESCRVAVEAGEFRMAWIGLVDQATMRIAPVAATGVQPEFLQLVKDHFSLNALDPLGNTLSAQAIRDGRPVVSNDIRHDVRVQFARDLMAPEIASMAILPLKVADHVVGVMLLYADEVGFFDDEEIKLLTELADDIGFALDHIAKAERLDYLAYYDEVTGLPNRTLFLERVSQSLRTRNGGKHMLAVALVDIERFRNVNDTLSRSAGDELLQLVAQRMLSSAVAFDAVARVGVNSFGVVVRDPRDAGGVALALEQLLRICFSKPFRLRGADLRMSGKGGIALYPVDGGDAETLLRNAEAALKRAKGSAEGLLFYAPEMDTRVAETLNLESRLRTALELDQFVLHYQPKVSLESGLLTGAEALIRWNDPQHGLVAPGQFIPMLEETGLIYEVGLWALRKAVADNLRWRAAGLAPLRIAVNVSPLQLRHRGFVDALASVVGVDPHAAAGLELEITESVIMADVQRNIESLQAIRAMGIRIAIDDFGTGYSSLGHLATLPVDTLKIDRSFVVRMPEGPQGLVLVATIINLAHSLSLKVVAEGVETEEQAGLLRTLRCEDMQGYLFSRPVPADVFEANFLVPLQHG